MALARDVLLLAFEFVRLSQIESFIVSCFDVVIMHVVSFDHYSYRVQTRHLREYWVSTFSRERSLGGFIGSGASKRVRLSGGKVGGHLCWVHYLTSSGVSVCNMCLGISLFFTLGSSKTAHS